MRQSNGYIIFYASILSVVCSGLLVGANLLLKDKQAANVALEQKTSILATVMTLEEGSDIEKLYRENVRELVVNSEGDVVPGMTPKQIVIATEYKKSVKDRMLPVYEFRNKQDTTQVDYVVFPVFGAGLWDAIWGYVALESNMNTVKGVKFEHKGETPGLGARITDEEIQGRYPGKEVYENGKLVSVTMMKGEGNDYSGDKHKVDGMSGATLTAKGVNNMLAEYLSAYEGYINKHKK